MRRRGGVVIAFDPAGDGYQVGDRVRISGALEARHNGDAIVTSVTSSGFTVWERVTWLRMLAAWCSLERARLRVLVAWQRERWHRFHLRTGADLSPERRELFLHARAHRFMARTLVSLQAFTVSNLRAARAWEAAAGSFRELARATGCDASRAPSGITE